MVKVIMGALYINARSGLLLEWPHIYLQKDSKNVEKKASVFNCILIVYCILSKVNKNDSRIASPWGLCSNDLTCTNWGYATSMKIKLSHPCRPDLVSQQPR